MKKLFTALLLIGLACTARAQTTNYFCDTGENGTTWDTVESWWTDAAHTQELEHLPLSNDVVVIDCDMTAGPGETIPMSAIIVSSNALANFTGALGNVIVNDSAILTGGCTVNGNATFNDNSKLSIDGDDSATVTGNATFNDSSVCANGGTVNGNILLNHSAQMQGGVAEGNGIANDDVYINGGSIQGDAVFNNHVLFGGTVGGDATFNDESQFLTGTVLGFIILPNSRKAAEGTIESTNPNFRIRFTNVGFGVNGSSIMGCCP